MSAERIVQDYLRTWELPIVIMDIALEEIGATGKLLDLLFEASDALADGDTDATHRLLEMAHDTADSQYRLGFETDLIDALIHEVYNLELYN
jgi:hypothetical protein